jgi:integrase
VTHVRVKGFQIFRDRHGRPRCYHRRTRVAIDLEKSPLGSAAFFAACSTISALQEAAPPPKPGTLGLLIADYRGSQAFGDLAPRTRQDYQRVFDYLRPIADTPLVRFNRPLIVSIRDRAATKRGRRFGNYVKQVLSLLFAWGAERGVLEGNPADNIRNLRRPRGAPAANRPWGDAEREAVLAEAPPHMKVPFALMMFCGLDPQDALRLPRSAIRDGMIDTRRGKTEEPIWIPLPTPVKAALADAPQHDAITVVATKRGRVWTVDGFRASWRPLKQRLQDAGRVSTGLTLKGLRHTVATILAEMGYDDRTIADMLGQRTLAMAQHYSKRADRSRKMAVVVRQFDAEVNRRRTKLVKPAEQSVKPANERR